MFRIRRMGCNGTHKDDFIINRPKGYDCYLLLMVKTPAKFYIKGAEYLVAPDTLIIYPPNTPHHYKAAADLYINDWMQFDADEAMIKSMKLPINQFVSIGSSTNLYPMFQLLAETFYSGHVNHDVICYHMAQALFYSIADIIYLPYGLRRKELIELRLDIYSNPSYDWNISYLASRLNVSQGHIQYLYKNTFGVSCQKDIEKSRMEHACRLLSATNMSVKQISYDCGYQNSEHFMRSFKKYHGITPSKYRCEYTNSPGKI